MANRVMEQKRMKIKRMRRAWAKPLSRKSGMNPNRIVLNEYKERAKGLAIDERDADMIAAELIFREDMGFSKKLSRSLAQAGAFPREKQTPHGRIEALRRQGELEAVMPDGCDLRIRGPGPSNCYQESFIYFNAQKTCWLVLHRDLRKRIQRRSITYSSKELLLMLWNMDKTTWVERISIPDTPSD